MGEDATLGGEGRRDGREAAFPGSEETGGATDASRTSAVALNRKGEMDLIWRTGCPVLHKFMNDVKGFSATEKRK